MTLAEWLAAARAAGLDRLDAQLMLGHVLGRSRSWVLAHDDSPLEAAQWHTLSRWIERRADGEPLAYLLGEKEFFGLRLQVDTSVLVPRPDTETLVAWALDVLVTGWAGVAQPRVVDLGTGSGAIALAVRSASPSADVTATDRSPDALETARRNAERLALPLWFLCSDWWSALGGERFHLVVSNPPYIAGDDPHLPALRHEPREALTPGGDGLDAFRRIVGSAGDHLLPNGWLLLEHGHDQALDVATLLAEAGFSDITHRQDLAGIERCTGGRWRSDR